MMRNQPNERMDSRGTEQRTEAWPANGRRQGDTDDTEPRPSTRWVQLAYDLEQYGDVDPEQRGEVY
jgi:hypothetical protein